MELRIVFVVKIVRAFPYAGRCQNVAAKYYHQVFSRLRLAENGMMLMVVVNHKHTHKQQA
jgi:hypothetical protein